MTNRLRLFTAELIAFQNRRLAETYLDHLETLRDTTALIDQRRTGLLVDRVAIGLHKLMAYKDEYEVARLALLDESQQRYRAVGGPKTKVVYHLHPPMLRSIGMNDKIKFGRTGTPSFKALRAARKVRGTKLDPFGIAKVRRLERAMIPQYEGAVATLTAHLDATNLSEAVAIASLPDQVRGYEHIKLARATVYQAELSKRLARFARS